MPLITFRALLSPASAPAFKCLELSFCAGINRKLLAFCVKNRTHLSFATAWAVPAQASEQRACPTHNICGKDIVSLQLVSCFFKHTASFCAGADRPSSERSTPPTPRPQSCTLKSLPPPFNSTDPPPATINIDFCSCRMLREAEAALPGRRGPARPCLPEGTPQLATAVSRGYPPPGKRWSSLRGRRPGFRGRWQRCGSDFDFRFPFPFFLSFFCACLVFSHLLSPPVFVDVSSHKRSRDLSYRIS